MQFGLVYWLLKTIIYGYIAGFFLFTVILSIYSEDNALYEEIRVINIALSWIFALGSLRELVVLVILRMKPHG